jgi:hypothetical protein
MNHFNLIIDDKTVDEEYVQSVYAYADPDTRMLSPGDARRLLHQHGLTWDDYVVGEGGGLADWPAGSRDPRHLLDFLGYRA